ncbi:hypothetical protein TSAR_008624 [Trichomalopsis sarcophagae]|uniref:Odorant receptor n=1 Tax=Trichomalopsis sarcophagae TaxID=543379 RepID=A0A232EM12_9HYME|nr:hypothetical protein TSAR_008624 [Trichomalopsis sarcophagae]
MDKETSMYMAAALLSFTTLPIAPMVLNFLKPLNESRPKIFILGGEFFTDRLEHYGKIYLFDCVCCSITAIIICAVDSMYAVCIEHCLGLFAIIKFRLQMSTKFINNKSIESKQKHEDISYELIVQTIQLHKKIIMLHIIASSYSSSFLILMGLNMIILSFESVLILIKLNNIIEVVRFGFILLGIVIHLFYISWPGQKLIDFSVGLFQDAYVNEWYESSIKAQKLLGFMTLRCIRPCQITAGGIYVINFSNFASIVKTSLSYMTLFASLR